MIKDLCQQIKYVDKTIEIKAMVLRKRVNMNKKRTVEKIISFMVGFVFATFWAYKFLFLVCANKDRRITMFSEYFYTLDKWMKLNRKQYLLKDYLLKRGYRNIAIYGIGVMGKQLIDDLQEGEVKIVYVIDQKCGNCSYQFPVKTMDDKLENVDTVIVTPSYEFGRIKERLERKVFCPIISLRNLVEEWWYEEYS